MSHMVMFRSAEGKPGYHQTGSLDEAIAFVEHLRNQEQVPEARIFRMEEVPIEVKTYYKIEVATRTPAAMSVSPPVPAGTGDKVRVPEDQPVAVEAAPSVNGGPAGARFGRFNRS